MVLLVRKNENKQTVPTFWPKLFNERGSFLSFVKGHWAFKRYFCSYQQIYITTKKYPYFALLNFLCVIAQMPKLVYVKSVGKTIALLLLHLDSTCELLRLGVKLKFVVNWLLVFSALQAGYMKSRVFIGFRRYLPFNSPR